MKKALLTLSIITVCLSCNSGKEDTTIEAKDTQQTATDSTSTIESKNLKPIETDDDLIATALMAAPAESRANATVKGFNMAGEFVTLKEGTNEYICIADNPTRDGFNAACYHKDLEPFMARGRELRAEGKSGQEIFDIREKEAKDGMLDMGKPGSTLHIYYGQSTMYNPETSEVDGAKYRYVVYLPWATSESTGLPEKPIASNHPWIMNPGTHRAHIMITPLNEKE